MTALQDAKTPDELFTLLNAGRFFDLTGLVAVVTGGASGIGLMTVTTLLANGAKVFIVDRAKDDLKHVLEVYKQVAGDRLVGLEADVSQKSEATRIAGEISSRTSYVNVLFNNAGISGRPIRPVTERSTDPKEFVEILNDYEAQDFQDVFNINTFAAYFWTVAFIPLLCASKESAGSRFVPQVVNTCSLNSWSKIRTVPAPASTDIHMRFYDLATSWDRPAYQLSKGAIHHLTKILAHKLIPLKIRVNGFAPGLFLTGMTTRDSRTPLGFAFIGPSAWNGESTASHGEAFKAPMQQLGRFEDLSGLVLMLVTNKSIDGEVILIDGGSLLRHSAFH